MVPILTPTPAPVPAQPFDTHPTPVTPRHHQNCRLRDARMQGATCRRRTSSWKSLSFFLGVRLRWFSRGGRKTFLSALVRFMCPERPEHGRVFHRSSAAVRGV